MTEVALASGQIVWEEEVEKRRSQIRRRETREGTETLTRWGKGHKEEAGVHKVDQFQGKDAPWPSCTSSSKPCSEAATVAGPPSWAGSLESGGKMETHQSTEACTLTQMTAHVCENAAGAE